MIKFFHSTVSSKGGKPFKLIKAPEQYVEEMGMEWDLEFQNTMDKIISTEFPNLQV